MSIFSKLLRNRERVSEANALEPVLRRYAKLHEFLERRIAEDLYPEPPSQLHTAVTNQVLEKINSTWGLRDKRVLDVGCGQGVALEKFAEYGAIATGLTFGEDFAVCRARGFDVYEMDMSFLDFEGEKFDLIWARHSLEHSLFPYFTLQVFYDALAAGGMLYVEVPAPDTSANHQQNKNHYSCLTKGTWISLFERVGFVTVEAYDLRVELVCGPDTWFAFYLEKPKPVAKDSTHALDQNDLIMGIPRGK